MGVYTTGNILSLDRCLDSTTRINPRGSLARSGLNDLTPIHDMAVLVRVLCRAQCVSVDEWFAKHGDRLGPDVVLSLMRDCRDLAVPRLREACENEGVIFFDKGKWIPYELWRTKYCYGRIRVLDRFWPEDDFSIFRKPTANLLGHGVGQGVPGHEIEQYARIILNNLR